MERTPRRLTPFGQQCFFGYYDLRAWSADGARHLAHRVTVERRLNPPQDTAELLELSLDDGEPVVLAETTAWNFQQGAMLQYHPRDDRKVLYNSRRSEGLCGVVHDLDGGIQVNIERPMACVDPLGRFALSIDFERLFSFRPGYGYATTPAQLAPIPDDDGVFVVDLGTGEAQLVLSLRDLWELTDGKGTAPTLLINHITLNPSGTRFVALVRYAIDDAWKTAVVTANSDGGDPFLLRPYGYASHYCWVNDTTLLIHADADPAQPGPQALVLLKDGSQEATLVDPAFFREDGHCWLSPDQRWLLYDSYPFTDGLRHLYLYDWQARCGQRIASFVSRYDEDWDLRCDLHARFSPDSQRISFDSTHEGFRAVYVMDVE